MNLLTKTIAVALIAFTLNGYAQDIHFSQFFSSPLSLSPAFTGNHDGDWSVMNNFRSQWKTVSTPYKTTSIGYDRNFYYYNEKISAGIYVVDDKSGSALLTVNKIYLSGAYHKTIKGNTFHFGIQPGFVIKSYGKDGLTLPDQFDMTTGYFNSGLSTGEAALGENLSYFDFNMGGAWSKRFRKLEPMVALSFFHLFTPTEAFADSENNLPVRTVLYGNVKYDLAKKLTLEPHLLYMRHKKADEFLLGSNVVYKLNKNSFDIKSVYVGFFYRDGLNLKVDAFYPVVGMKINKFDLGFSYDFNMSPLKVATNYKGAIEFSLIYTGASSLLPKVTIPCDRF